MGKVKQWKSGGVEDKEIKKLIKEGKVTKYTKSSYLQSEHAAIFKHFSVNVIRNHLTDVKRKYGLFIGDEIDTDEHQNEPSTMSNREEDEYIASLASSNGSNDVMTGFDKVSYQNYPIICQTYTDPDSESEKVLLMVSMPGGSENVKIEMGDDGLLATIKYSWAKALYDVNNLFKKPFDKKELSLHHPLISCYKKGLSQARKRIDFAPVSTMKVRLPIKVQKVPGSWKNWGVMRDDGTQSLIAVFTGLVKEYEIKETDETVTFEN